MGNTPRHSLDQQSLEAIRDGVDRKLSRRFQPSFVARYAEEAISQALVELERARRQGIRVASPIGWTITVAEWRAIDQARREGLEFNGEAAAGLLENTEDPAPTTEALALRDIAVGELREAVSCLTGEQREAVRSPTGRASRSVGPRPRWGSAWERCAAAATPASRRCGRAWGSPPTTVLELRHPRRLNF